MIGLKLDRENIPIRKHNIEIDVLDVKNEDIIQSCIDLFNREIKWEDMFTLNDAKDRMDSSEKMYVGYHNGVIFGYFWIKKQTENTYYIYNVFSKNTDHKRHYGATDMIYHIICDLDFTTIMTDVDDWNIKSLNVFKKLGFQHM